MTFVTIHRSGESSDCLRVDSCHNGAEYAVHFGAGTGPFRTLFFQGDDAADLRASFDALEEREPETPSRDHWLTVLDPHL